MDYTKFLQDDGDREALKLPWFGGATACDAHRTWRVKERPERPGWYAFSRSGRFLNVVEAVEPEPEAWDLKSRTGYLAGEQLVTNDDQRRVFGLNPEEEIARFAPVRAAEWFDGNLWYTGQEFESEVEMLVRDAFEDESGIAGIKGVVPALAQVFLIEATKRQLAREAEMRAREEDERREHERKVAEWRRSVEGRIAYALTHTGAELVDWRASGRNQVVVRYRLGGRKFECVVDKETLRIVDSGICLEGADQELNLSSLPSAVREAIEAGQLHVYRHA